MPSISINMMVNKKLVLLVCFFFAPIVACAETISAIKHEHDALNYAVTITERYKLTTNRMECITVETEEETKMYFLVRLRENHTAECGGIPEFAPTLFFLNIRKKDGRVTTDAYRFGFDEFLPVREAARKIAARRAKEKKHQQPSNERAQK